MPITGTVALTGLLAPNNSADTYPITDPRYGIEGYRTAADASERNAIVAERRRQGMAVYTQSDSKLWTLNAAPWTNTDSDWTEFVGGAGAPGPQGPPGADGHSPALTWTGDQILIDSANNGPHLTGPSGTNGAQGIQGPPGVIAATSPIAYNSGTQTVSLNFAALGTGTPNNTTYLRGDATWATIAAGGTTWISGPVDPTGGVGEPGNWYLNSTTGSVWIKGADGWAPTYAPVQPPILVSQGGTGLTSINLGSLLYGGNTNTIQQLAGNATTAQLFLSQTGTGTTSSAPSWVALTAGTVPAAASINGGLFP